MRATVLRLSLVLGACLTTGCATSKWAWKRPATPAAESMAKSDSAKAEPAKTETSTPAAEKSPEKPAEKPVEVVADKSATGTPTSSATASTENPFKPSRSTSPEAADKPALQSLTSAAPTAVKPLGDLNKETLLLINRELQDATPEERAEWFEQLKHVDPALVPEILRARRMSLQLAKTPAPESPQSSEILLAGGAIPAPRNAQPVRSPAAPPTERPGIGGRSPWDAPAGSIAADPFGVVQTGHASTSSQRTLMHADYAEPAGSQTPLEHAVHRVPTNESGQPIVLQNYETPAGGSPFSPNGPSSWTPPHTDARLLPIPPEHATSTRWPEQTAAIPNPGGRGNVVPFGTQLVQNVAGLVPGRNSQSANVPAIATVSAGITPGGGSPFQSQLEQATAYLEQEVAALPVGTTPASQAAYIRKHVALRLLYLMGDHQERALTAIPGIPPAEQEFWQQLLWGVINSLDVEHMPQSKDRATQTITQLNSAVRRLQEQADLQIRNVAFCRQILYFGNYEKLPRNEFSPGQEALLYAEIDNFKSEPTAAGQYRTLLRSSVEILSPSGELRKQIEFPATEDLCSTYRRDYFHNYQFRIPERIPLGPHILKLTVFDELSGKLTSYSLNFSVN